jgi:hypothetical protein
VAATVLAAALAEGALTFVAKHAKDRDLGLFRSSDFPPDRPRQWKFDKLVESAVYGGDSAILDSSALHRARSLVKARNRIHAGACSGTFRAVRRTSGQRKPATRLLRPNSWCVG